MKKLDTTTMVVAVLDSGRKKKEKPAWGCMPGKKDRERTPLERLCGVRKK